MLTKKAQNTVEYVFLLLAVTVAAMFFLGRLRGNNSLFKKYFNKASTAIINTR